MGTFAGVFVLSWRMSTIDGGVTQGIACGSSRVDGTISGGTSTGSGDGNGTGTSLLFFGLPLFFGSAGCLTGAGIVVSSSSVSVAGIIVCVVVSAVDRVRLGESILLLELSAFSFFSLFRFFEAFVAEPV